MTISILSAGAIEPGLVASVGAFNLSETDKAGVTWATAPAIRARLDKGEAFDVVIAPDAVIDDFAHRGKVSLDHKVYVGRVGVGVVVRSELAVPDLSTAQALKSAVLEAQSLVFNRASSGIYIEGLLKRLGIFERVLEKTRRFDNGPAMMAHLMSSKVYEIGFGAMVEIGMFTDKGLKLAAPLPAEIQNWTRYFAAPLRAAHNALGACAFVDFLATPRAREIFAAHGID